MSLRSTVRAMPTLLKVAFAATVAYRAEMMVWVLSTTMPFIMLALWSAVAAEAPVVAPSGRTWDGETFVAYFLVTFVVRQLNASWASWEMNYEVRTGALSMRLLRPLNPLVGYAAENLAGLPMRLLVSMPVVVGMLLWVGPARLPHTLAAWAMTALALAGGWLITFLSNAAIGCLSLFMQSSIKVMDVYLAVLFVLGGYLFPLELSPPWLSAITGWLPFRYQLAFPIEMLNSMHEGGAALDLLARQWTCVGALFVLTALLWRFGIRRFAAYGG